ncbi:MAG: SPASM domain-containing protein [Candidatus Omnitrophica bacterium]|nr:SPASM domain-containing protein [Candidatus Omnitrophota bacterium]
MYDIRFFRVCGDIKRRITGPDEKPGEEEIAAFFERERSRLPAVFNIETTNVCNMTCIMCPRTTLMDRPIKTMDMELFEKVLSQIKPFTGEDLDDFDGFIQRTYSIYPSEMSENAFYFYTSSRYLVLHGFGDPLLDPHIGERIKACTRMGVPTYFSCMPANIKVEKVAEMMKNGLGVIKFSMDSLDDLTEKKIRGEKSNFTDSYRKVKELISIKERDPAIKTKITVVMLALESGPHMEKMCEDFLSLWREEPVYAYVKSQDNRWLYEGSEELECRSHYESQYCEFPWMSLTVMADGSVVPCTQDYNAEMVMGNVSTETLGEIWNGKRYEEFRKRHIYGGFPGNYKCSSRCDIRLVSDSLKG